MEKGYDKIENVVDDSAAFVAGAAKTANRAVMDTAQKYLNAAGMKVNLQDISKKGSATAPFFLSGWPRAQGSS
jgi:hypothetical protein